MLLGHKPDGREGLLFPSIPPYVQKNGADGKGNKYGNTMGITWEQDEKNMGIIWKKYGNDMGMIEVIMSMQTR